MKTVFKSTRYRNMNTAKNSAYMYKRVGIYEKPTMQGMLYSFFRLGQKTFGLLTISVLIILDVNGLYWKYWAKISHQICTNL